MTTFTREQLADASWVRDHEAEIRQAHQQSTASASPAEQHRLERTVIMRRMMLAQLRDPAWKNVRGADIRAAAAEWERWRNAGDTSPQSVYYPDGIPSDVAANLIDGGRLRV